MKVEKYQSVKAQTIGIKVRTTMPKRKRTTLRENIETKRTKSLEGLGTTPNITKHEVKFQMNSMKMDLNIENVKDNDKKIKSDAGSFWDEFNLLQKKIQAARKK